MEVAEIFDTTWAGDTFNGALAFSLASGEMLIERVCFANLVGSLSITKKGSQVGMSTLEMIKSHETLKNYEVKNHDSKKVRESLVVQTNLILPGNTNRHNPL